MFPHLDVLKVAAAGALIALSAANHSPYAQTLLALTTPANADEMVQNSGPVTAHEPILTTIGNKHVIAFFVPGNGQCNVQAVIWRADDKEAKSAGGFRVGLNPDQTASIDSSGTESVTLKCGHNADTLAAISTGRQFASE
jgi:hypothetical protein